MRSGPDYSYLALLYDLLLKSSEDKSRFASEKTQNLFEQYIAEAKNQGLDTDTLSLSDINKLHDFHRENIENKTEALSPSLVTLQPEPTILPPWIPSFLISIVENRSTLPVGFVENIPNEIFICIALQLQLPKQLPELAHFAQTSKDFWKLFQPQLKESNYLLSYVMKADEKGVNNALMELQTKYPNNYWEHVLKKARGMELCERKWNSVSPLEYAAWIGDMFMVERLLDHVPAEGLQEALEQLLAVKTDGLEHGPHMAPFYALINACKHYDAHFDQFNNWDERENYCVKTIGGLQLNLSCFGLQWFCDDEPFYPVPKFDRAPRRSFMLDGKPWDPFHSSLGASFFLYKMSAGYAVTMCLGGALQAVEEAAAFEALCQASSNQLDLVITSLEQRIAATNTPQPK